MADMNACASSRSASAFFFIPQTKQSSRRDECWREAHAPTKSIHRRANLLMLISFGVPFILFCKTASAAAITYVQGNYATPQTPESSVSVEYISAQAAGDLNVIVVGWNDSTATVEAISDSTGNTYSLAVGPTIQSGIASQSIYFAKNIASAAAGANSVTVTFSVAAAYPDIRILEYSGADLNSPVDVVGAKSGKSSTSSVSATTTNATDLLFAANLVRTFTTRPGHGFAQRLLTSPDGDIAEDELVASAGSYTATASLSPSGAWIMQMVAFRTPAASGGTAVIAPAALSCANSSMTGAGSDTCSVTLNAAAATGGFSVTLASNNAAVTVPSSVTVAAGATTGSFSATVSAVTTAQAVTLTASAGTVSKTFSLQLEAYVPTLSISTTSIAFGDVTLNTPATQSLTLTSTGTAPVIVSSGTISGTGFSVSGVTFPLTLNANQTATLSVEFDPTAAGAASGTLTISSNSSTNSTATLSLSGTGESSEVYEVNVTWIAPTSSPDPVAAYDIYRSPSGSSTYTLMGSVTSSVLAYSDANNIQGGQSYDYIIESVDSSGNESVPSNVASVSIP
jgi:hypothetical protein